MNQQHHSSHCLMSKSKPPNSSIPFNSTVDIIPIVTNHLNTGWATWRYRKHSTQPNHALRNLRKLLANFWGNHLPSRLTITRLVNKVEQHGILAAVPRRVRRARTDQNIEIVRPKCSRRTHIVYQATFATTRNSLRTILKR